MLESSKKGKMEKKRRKIVKKGFLACLLVVGLFFLGACSAGKSKELKDTKTLETVALKYWNNRLITRDYQASYNREVKLDLVPFEEYAPLVSRTGKFVFSALKILNSKMETDKGQLEISLMAKGPGMPAAFPRTFKDKWIYSKSGEWQHLFSKDQP
jgi:hypothetical protein